MIAVVHPRPPHRNQIILAQPRSTSRVVRFPQTQPSSGIHLSSIQPSSFIIIDIPELARLIHHRLIVCMNWTVLVGSGEEQLPLKTRTQINVRPLIICRRVRGLVAGAPHMPATLYGIQYRGTRGHIHKRTHSQSQHLRCTALRCAALQQQGKRSKPNCGFLHCSSHQHSIVCPASSLLYVRRR